MIDCNMEYAKLTDNGTANIIYALSYTAYGCL